MKAKPVGFIDKFGTGSGKEKPRNNFFDQNYWKGELLLPEIRSLQDLLHGGKVRN